MIATLLGRRLTSRSSRHRRLVCALHGRVRRASFDYLHRVHGRATLGQVIGHLRCFAHVTVDRLFLPRRARAFKISTHGEEHLASAREHARRHPRDRPPGQLRGPARPGRQASPVNVLGYFHNAPLINAVLRGLNPDRRTLHPDPARHPSFIFDVEDRVRAGEMVGTMGDRVGFDGKGVRVPFLGGDALFPTGPYLLAALLLPSLPGLRPVRAPNRYELHCEPFADRVELPRGHREEALRILVARYATRLEAYCRLAPENWFNFYDFWSAS